MNKEPQIGACHDEEERGLIEAFESGGVPLVSALAPERKREIEAMARAAINDERSNISLSCAQKRLGPPKITGHAGGRPLPSHHHLIDL
jgi:hypothetical protein